MTTKRKSSKKSSPRKYSRSKNFPWPRSLSLPWALLIAIFIFCVFGYFLFTQPEFFTLSKSPRPTPILPSTVVANKPNEKPTNTKTEYKLFFYNPKQKTTQEIATFPVKDTKYFQSINSFIDGDYLYLTTANTVIKYSLADNKSHVVYTNTKNNI